MSFGSVKYKPKNHEVVALLILVFGLLLFRTKSGFGSLHAAGLGVLFLFCSLYVASAFLEGRKYERQQGKIISVRQFEFGFWESLVLRSDIEVVYEYEVNGRVFRSNRESLRQILIGGLKNKQDLLSLQEDGLLSNKPITVFVHRTDFNRSVLTLRVAWWIAAFALGVALVCLGLFFHW